MIAADHAFMARALRLAARGMTTAHPNPRVGCVLVRDGVIVGEGWHTRTGGPHAEIVALAEAGTSAHGATAYVTLEPCCHIGRTPPCTDALIEAGVTRVVAAMTDPNTKVAGQGLAQLRSAGLTVNEGILQAQAETLNRGFIMRMRQQRSWVTCKLAMSLDGRTALANGRSRWITGPAARRDVQRLRARSGAIITGIGTVLADDPALTVREAESDRANSPYARQPLRVVLDTQLRMSPQARMLALEGGTLLITSVHNEASGEPLIHAGAAIAVLPRQGNRIDLPAMLGYLAAAHEINDALLEAGPTLAGAMLQAGLIDELVIYLAPCLLGSDARGLFHLVPGLQDVQDRIELDITDLRAVGRDWRITARCLQKNSSA